MRCFRTRGKKGEQHTDPLDPPRRRANKQRGHGTYDNDRPPIVGTVGRHSGQCRLRVRHHTDGKTLQQHVHGYTQRDTTCYTDEWQGYNRIKRTHHTVCHGQKEWARDDDGDGIAGRRSMFGRFAGEIDLHEQFRRGPGFCGGRVDGLARWRGLRGRRTAAGCW